MEPANVLRIETLDELWSDKDNVILHACFQLLTDCIEKESLFTGHVDWESDEEMKSAKSALNELYEWWKKRVQLEKNDKTDPIWTEDQYNADTEMLIRLIRLRKFLWT